MTKRFRLRSLMIMVALSGVGLFAAITIVRICAMLLRISSESIVVVLPAYVFMVLALVAALTLIVIGVISFGLRLRAILRDSSAGQGLSRSGQ